MTYTDTYHSPPLGHCTYCQRAVCSTAHFFIVRTIYGLLRLCPECAGTETASVEVDQDTWVHGTTLPERWPKTRGKRKGSRHDKRG